MTIGRITGPLLADNLLRDGVNLAFETDLLYLDVVNNRIGIRRSDPLYELDIKGTSRSSLIIATTGTIGLVVISTNTISTAYGPINVEPADGDDINLRSNTTVFGDMHVTGNSSLDGSMQLGSNIAQDKLILNAKIDSDIIPQIDNTYKIGDVSSSWAEGYFNELYTKIIASATGTNIAINPSAGLLEINGNLRVNGSAPIGTFPIVTNLLYVTMDGDDTNDGRGMDPSRACRTISGALRSPYYGPGTQIRVAPGHYLENNPLLLDPYTSVIGSDLRTCSIEPINKTQDLFHVQSGCYIAQLQMTNGRSGLLPIQNASGYNRGAYCTAFPPSVNGSKIDVYHSPYIQNCTNQSGPWLKDGTMFVPNQTIQIPAAIGTGTWIAGTDNIIVSISSGTILTGMSINQGPQNLGFFDARTLLLANKKFLQEQVIEYITSQTAINIENTSSIWYNFKYNQQKCYRDVGILIENLSYDTAFGGNEKSVESGSAYYDGVISLIAGQELQTTDAINYLNSLTQLVITNTTVTGITVVTEPQVINFVLDEGIIASPSLAANFKIVTDIINSGTSVAPTVYKSSGPDNYILSAEVLLQSNRSFIQHDVVEFVNNTYSLINRKKDKCRRDSGLIVDAIVQDLLFSTSSQSTFAGLQYYNQNSTVIPGEETTTTNTFAYVRDLAIEIVQNITGGTRYSTGTQITNLPAATIDEANKIQSEMDLIIGIINTGTSGVTDLIVPNGLDPSADSDVQHAYALLLANKIYIQQEAIAYITSNHPGFSYDSTKCERDVGFIIDSIAFDLLYGGNKQAIQSGVCYFGFNTNSSAIPGETPATIAAYNFIKSIIPYIVRGIPVPSVYQVSTSQITNMNTATLTEAAVLNLNVDKIINILSSGTAVADPLRPISLEISTSTSVVNAARIVNANRQFIADETVEYVNLTYAFSYNKNKCFRDSELIVDSIVQDLLFSTSSQSTFAGLQYYSQNSTVIPGEETTTTNTFAYVRDLAKEIVQNITTGFRYSTGTQITTLPAATQSEADKIQEEMDLIIGIINTGTNGVTDLIVPNKLEPSLNVNVKQAYDLLLANKPYIQQEAIAYITSNHPGFSYDSTKCERDVGFIIDSIAFDLLYGGNKQAIQSGVCYFGFNTNSSAIPGETTATIAAYTFIKNIIPYVVRGIPVPSVYQNSETQIINMDPATLTEAAVLNLNVDKIINILSSGTVVADPLRPISLEINTSTSVINAAKIVSANRKFIAAETVAFVNATYAFSYNESKCFRDAGLIVDAITYDLILGGNSKSIEAGLGYYIGNKSVIQTQTTQTVAAINHARDISLQIIANIPVTPQPNNTTPQIINTYFSGGASATEAVTRNFNIITDIIQNGPDAAPENYIGSGLFAATGINTNDVREATKITSVTPLGNNQYQLMLNKPTIGAASNATLYIGNTNVFPLTDENVPEEWGLRRVDPLGAMGGSLVDGGVVSERSPINSFVYDAFTQVSQGGRGIHITNNGYAQLVSVFTIFCSNAVLVENGGIASITNSNANFGDLCLVAKGYGRREFSGTVYNPPYPSDLPDGIGQYYPNGYWPQNAQVKIFVPDTIYRPHIGLVMEVEPPKDYVNVQGFSGFLNAAPLTSTLTTGSISIVGIDTTGISIGNNLNIRDQFGNQTGSNGKLYADTGTIVTDVGYRTVYLNKSLTSGGGEKDNPNYFTLYFSGNAYYNVLSSTTSTSLTPFGQSVIPGQISTETSSLVFLNTITNQVISNITVIPQSSSTIAQVFNSSLVDGGGASSFITERFNTVTNIIVNGVDTYPDRPATTGTIVAGAGTAIKLIRDNLDFLTEQTVLWVNANNPGFTYDQEKCARDVKLILRQIIYDLESGGYYYSTYAGLAYWSRIGTHHIISLEDQVRDPELFPDGATVNFYQRSYMSALGYTFEYVGAGITYGALPQVGRADPVQDKEVVMLNNGKVFFTSTDQNGDFRIGPGLVISQATGVLSGRTFTKSLFATMTPFILAVESGGA